ncbi:DgyrCDS11140 [Dimorphilus gyrociliatus]|uniref:DgyrCDS11140 n=1 Tax=Dimorphilus gyrociliatus TaxID=2664684 RepID=A0A7I8W2G1_9ANNE|nr:DgyrCDS11140 [Dimorphilus gyrociliatus]
MSSTRYSEKSGDEQDGQTFARPAAPRSNIRKSASSSGRQSSSKNERGGAAGAVDEDFFRESFTANLPLIQSCSARDVQERMSAIQALLSNSQSDWNKRCIALKEIRALIAAGASQYEEFFRAVRIMETGLIQAVRDLRSQIVREACITVAFMAQELGSKFDRFAEIILSHLINLIPNSAKVMSTSGATSLRFVLQHTHSHRLVPIIISHSASKSNVIRRECYDIIALILSTWSTHELERKVSEIQGVISRGMEDADSEARAHSRKAFRAFSKHFPERAETLRQSLDPAKQKMLQGEFPTSTSSSSIGSACGGRASSVVSSSSRTKPSSRARSTDRRLEASSSSSAVGRFTASDSKSRVRSSGSNLKTTVVTPKKSSIARSSSAADVGRMNSLPERVPIVNAENIMSTSTTMGELLQTVEGLQSLAEQAHSGKDIPIYVKITLSAPQPNDTNSESDDDSDLKNIREILSNCKPTFKTPKKLATEDNRSEQRRTSLPNLLAKSKPRKSVTGQSPTYIPTLQRSRPSRSSQSQPGSRSTSPSSHLNYLTNSNYATTPRKRSGIPRSQGASRETSPSRGGSTFGRERRLSSGSSKKGAACQRVPRANSRGLNEMQVELAFSDAVRARKAAHKQYDNDDGESETSSICSNTSFGGRSDDIAEVVRSLESKSWSEKREGLLSLQNFIMNSRTLSDKELRKVIEVLTKLFQDQHGKVFSTLLEVLPDLVRTYTLQLSDWLYVLLTRLLTKAGSDLLNSVNSRLWKCLEVIRDCFDLENQFQNLSKFIIDQSVSPSLRVKDAVLIYMFDVVQRLDSDVIGLNFQMTEVRLAISRLITWTSEPKSAEVRRSSAQLIVALFDANPPAFQSLISELPKPFRDPATKVLKNHVKTASAENHGQSDISSPLRRFTSNRNSTGATGSTPCQDKMKPEDFYASIKQTTADIEKLHLNRLDAGDARDLHNSDTASRDSGIQLHPSYNPAQYTSDDVSINRNAAPMVKSTYEEQIFDAEEDILFNDGTLVGDEMAVILCELSNHGTRFEQRRQALLNLLSLARGNTSTEVDWNEHFKTVLLLLLETVIGSEGSADNEVILRVLALRALRQLVQRQHSRFQPYIELTVMKVIEAQSEGIHKDVTRAAEDCAIAIAATADPRHILKIISPLISTAVYPRNVAALKMLTKVIENSTNQLVGLVINEVVPVLLVSYNSTESIVRKTSVMALVAITVKVGEEIIRPHLESLSTSKMKLLNLYIKRANGQASGVGSTASSSNTVHQSDEV